jgi:hypothetical protein
LYINHQKDYTAWTSHDKNNFLLLFYVFVIVYLRQKNEFGQNAEENILYTKIGSRTIVPGQLFNSFNIQREDNSVYFTSSFFILEGFCVLDTGTEGVFIGLPPFKAGNLIGKSLNSL